MDLHPRLIGTDPRGTGATSAGPAGDHALPDAYSRTIIEVIERVGPAVGLVEIRKPLRDLRGPMAYVDGFVVPVPVAKLAACRRMAGKAGKVWREHGALEYVECVADDMKPGKCASFPQSVKLNRGETVVFSWIVYKSRKHRDSVNAKVLKDPRVAAMVNSKTPPFDGKRMFRGGFKSMISL